MISLERFVDYGTPYEGTFGRLTFNDFTCYTVEQTWNDNIPFQSCIPPGEYFLEYYESNRFGPSAIIYGDTVSKFPHPDFRRNAILIHPANFSHDVQGCIGLGSDFDIMDGKVSVTNSRKTVRDFLNLINIGEVYYLNIYYRANEET